MGLGCGLGFGLDFKLRDRVGPFHGCQKAGFGEANSRRLRVGGLTAGKSFKVGRDGL